MVTNGRGEDGYTSAELENAIRKRPNVKMDLIFCTNPAEFNNSVSEMYSEFGQMKQWVDCESDPEWHELRQQTYLMPDEYKDVDIPALLIGRCNTAEELDRMKLELFMYQDRELLPFLNYLHYLVETIKANNVVMGVGRGSSVASFALYKLGVHQIDSLRFDIPIEEFLK